MPPAAAQRLKQCRRVGVTAGLRLHEIDARLLIGLLRAQQRQIADISVLPLALRQIQCFLGVRGGGGGGLQARGVLV